MEYGMEPSAGALSMTVKCEPVVKEEPEWGESGTEPPHAALYADHDIKDELVCGPELLQRQDVAYPMRNVLFKQEDSEPEPPDEIKVEIECTYAGPRDPSIDSCTSLKQFQLKRCFVRLSRIPLKDLYTYCPTFNLKHRHTNSQSQETPSLMSQQPRISKSVIPQVTEKQNSCTICYKSFTKRSNLIRHVRLHTGEKPFVCEVCEKRFADQSRLSRHKEVHNSVKAHTCGICDKQFKRKSHLNTHFERHSDEERFRCKKRFDGQRLSRHIRLCEVEERHKCDKCDKQFVQQSDLKKHLLTHGDTDKFHRCSVCCKMFSKQSDLIRHVRIHTGEKPYVCDVCEKRFADQSGLSRHNVVHNGVKSHTCVVCDKRFKQKAHLNRHIKIHTGEKRFCCDVCEKRFTQKESLICHMRIHTGQKPFVCHICSKGFVQKWQLDRHVRAHSRDKHSGLQIGTRQRAASEIDNDSPLLKVVKISAMQF